MPETKVQAVLTEAQGGPREAEVLYDFGGSVEEAVDKFGEEAVLNNFVAQAKINLQAALRRWMKPDKDGELKTDDEILALAAEWKPGARSVTRKSTVAKAKDLLGKMSDAEKAQLLAALKDQAEDQAGDQTDG
jgi:hypothetical protein